jgi:hypothetical protein
MFVRIASWFSIGTLGLLAVLSGCGSGSNTSVPSPANVGAPAQVAGAFPDNNGKGHGGSCNGKDGGSKGGGSKGSGGGLIYTAQLYGHDLNVYSSKGSGSGFKLTYLCSLTGGVVDPEGTVTTVNGWWYVANGAGNNVLIYRTKHSGPQGPVSSLSDYDEIPVNVDVTPSRHLVAVSNSQTTSGGSGSLSVYLHRQAVPTRTLTYSGSGTIYGAGVAVDHNGNCYWAFNAGSPSGTGAIVEFAGCNGSGTLIQSSIPNVGGLAFDQQGNLYYVESIAGGAIYKCQKGASWSCGSFASGFTQPLNMNFDYHGKDLWVADTGGYIDAVNLNGVTEFTYATGNSNPPFGIAPEPGE